ncbi:Fatty acid hydroxylase [Dillenia turbinata]|uniref:Fatty acid hydroxylase n=1 Tax=Dillenia turbinata TaxID=194707 RepID=A0AAN8VLC0_9MAGN
MTSGALDKLAGMDELIDQATFHMTTFSIRAEMVAKGFTVDLNKALVFQVGHLGEAYEEWVHIPIISKEGPRFFASDILEFFTKTKWWVVPLVWLPFICWLVSVSLQRGLLPPHAALALAGGVLIWTLLEYTLHRFLFHMKTTSYWGNTLHYLLHGCHHKHPMDRLRLVFPPAAAAILSIPVWTMFKLLLTPCVAPAFFGGSLLGYVMYDCTHYYLHHGKPSNEVAQNLKRYHLNHHFRVQSKGFGITSPLWDKIFRTYPEPKTAENSR